MARTRHSSTGLSVTLPTLQSKHGLPTTALFRASNTDLEGKLPDLFLETGESGMVALPLQRRLADGARRHAALHERVAAIGVRRAQAGRR